MLHIACGIDDNYAPHAAAMLLSAFDNLPSGSTRTFVLHDDNLSEESIRNLSKTLGELTHLHLLKITDRMMSGLPTDTFHHACWHRIFLPDLLEDIDKVLYLDADMIIVDDLLPLWETDLEQYLFAAVVNPLYPFMPVHPINSLGLAGPSEYLNTGCLLMDLNKLRETNFTQKIKSYAAKHPDNLWPEQDAISALFPKQWKKLHPRWNVQTTFFDLSPDQLPVPKQQAIEAIESPAIIHFIGPNKPWHYLCKHPFQNKYREWVDKTVWGSSPLEGHTALNSLLRHLPLLWQQRILKFIRKLSL